MTVDLDAYRVAPPEVIPPGHHFMLGDSRGASDDSRFWGPVAASAIVGRVRI